MLWTVCALLRCPAAAGSSPDGLDAQLGFDGAVKIGVPLPLVVTLPPLDAGGPAELTVQAPALGPQVGSVVTSTVVPFLGVPGAPRSIHVPVVVSDPRRPLTIKVSVAGRELLRRSLTVTPEHVAARLLVAATDDRSALPSLHRLPGRAVAAAVSPGALPRLWQEYAAVDLLEFPDLDQASLDPAQQDALRTWVSLGGHLLVIARRAGPAPAPLAALLPAAAAGIRTVAKLPALAAGSPLAGPLTVTALAPRPGARRLTDGDLTIMAAWDVGRGQVTVWGVDPQQPSFLRWRGRLRWWDEALGQQAAPVVDPEAVADKLTVETPLDPLVHVEVGGAIVLYIGLVLALLRWRASLIGVAGCGLIVAVALWAFSALAATTRARSATLVQATVLEPVAGMRMARATTVAAVAVPYGGPYTVAVARGMIAEPITPSSNLRIEFSPAGTKLGGVLRAGEPARPFEALGAIPFPITIGLSPDGRRLLADLGSVRIRRVQLRSRDRVYEVGDLPAGSSVTAIRPAGWASTAEGGVQSDRIASVLGPIFQGPRAGGILGGTTPVLVGELDDAAPVFTLGGAASPGQRVTFLLMPLPLAGAGERR